MGGLTKEEDFDLGVCGHLERVAKGIVNEKLWVGGWVGDMWQGWRGRRGGRWVGGWVGGRTLAPMASHISPLLRWVPVSGFFWGGWVGGWVRWVAGFFSFRMTCWTLWVG